MFVESVLLNVETTVISIFLDTASLILKEITFKGIPMTLYADNIQSEGESSSSVLL